MLRITFVQRVIANYRIPFFNKLASRNKIQLIYGDAIDKADITSGSVPKEMNDKGSVHYFLFARFWWHNGLKKDLSAFAPDVVVLSPTPRNLSFLALLSFRKAKQTPLIGWGMGEMPGRNLVSRFLHKLAQKFVVSRLDGMLVYSSKAREYYVNELNFKGPIRIAFNSVCISAFSNYRLREFSAKRFKLVFVGRLIPEKKLEKLIKIVGRSKNWELAIIGAGENKYAESLEKLAERRSAKVTFWGALYGKQLSDILNRQHLFVLPARGGLAINHAMATGLPVLVSQGDGTEADLIKDQKTGFLFPEGNFRELEKKLKYLDENRIILKSVGLDGEKNLRKNHTLDQMAATFEEFIGDLLNENS